jgi:hypothetical protein
MDRGPSTQIFSKNFFSKKPFKDDYLSGIRLFLSKKAVCPPAYAKAPHCASSIYQ